jgi:hypothetical protein
MKKAKYNFRYTLTITDYTPSVVSLAARSDKAFEFSPDLSLKEFGGAPWPQQEGLVGQLKKQKIVAANAAVRQLLTVRTKLGVRGRARNHALGGFDCASILP